VTIADKDGLSLTQPVAITVTGTNDAPVLAADVSGPHTITEAPNTTGSDSPDTSFGTLIFTDVDLADTHQAIASAPTFGWSGGNLTAAQEAALAAASTLTLSETDSTGSGVGSIAFTYSAADKIFDFLTAGQTLTVTYNVTVTDNVGVSSTQLVMITIHGANDAAVIGDPSVHDVTEDVSVVNGNLTASGTIGNLQIADIASETDAFKLDTGAALQSDGSDAVTGLVITDATTAHAINSRGDHTTQAAWHASDDGRGGKTAHNAPASETGEDTSAQSTSADNHFGVSSPSTETPCGNGDHSASAFKPSVEHDATIDPGIKFASLPKDQLLQQPADNLIHIPAQPDDEADPAHPHADANQSVSADDANALHATVPSDLPALTALASDSSGTHGPATASHAPDEDTLADNGHHPIADPELDIASNAEHNGDNSSAAIGGADPAHGQGDESESAGSKFADDGKGSPPADHGHTANADPETNVPSNAEHSPDNLRHTPAQDGDNSSAVSGAAQPAHSQGDESELAVAKLADDGKGSPPADRGHHATADPETNSPSVAKSLPTQHLDDNSLDTPKPYDDNGSPAAIAGIDRAHGQADRGEPASQKFADDASPPSAHATGEGPSVPPAPADNGHHPTADPEINLAIAPNQPPEHATGNSPPTPAQPEDGPHPADPPVDVNELFGFNFADNGSDHDKGPDGAHAPDPHVDRDQLKLADDGSNHGTGPDGAHPAHPQADGNQSDSFKFADDGDHPGTITTNSPTALTAPSSDSSGTHGSSAPTLAKTLDVPDAETNQASDQFIFTEKAAHDPVAGHKPDVIETGQPLPHDVQQLTDIAHETNPASTSDPHPAMAPQDSANVQAQQHQDAFHLV